MGWNQVDSPAPPVLKGIDPSTYFFFVTDFVVPDDARSWPPRPITAAPSADDLADNLFATQFHPEKSQAEGLKFLRIFERYVSKSGKVGGGRDGWDSERTT